MPQETKTKKIAPKKPAKPSAKAKAPDLAAAKADKKPAKRSVAPKGRMSKAGKTQAARKLVAKDMVREAKVSIVFDKKPLTARKSAAEKEVRDAGDGPAKEYKGLAEEKAPVRKKEDDRAAKDDEGRGEEKGVSIQEEEEVFTGWIGKNYIPRKWEKPFYKVCLAASALVILLSLAEGSWLRAVTFFALAVILVFELRDEPRDIGYEINIDGIQIDGKLYKFEDIRSFALGKKAGSDIVKLEMKSSIFPVKELHLAEGQDALYIETLLEYFLPKETQEDMLFNFHKEEKSADLSDEEFINKKVDEYLKGHF